MKKLLYTVSIVALSAIGTTNANAQAFEEGSMAACVGYGFPNLGKSLLTSVEDEGNYKAKGFGPLHARFEYGLTDRYGIGLSINYNTFGATWTNTYDVYNSTTMTYESKTYNYEETYTSLAILVRFNRHFEVSDNVDIFSGFGVGYNMWKGKYESDDPLDETETVTFPIPVGFEATIGVRFYFTDNIGAYIEAGWAKSILQGGLAFRF